MHIIPAHIIHQGNAFFVSSGALMAAPILIDGTIEWDEATLIDEFSIDSEADIAVDKEIAKALGL